MPAADIKAFGCGRRGSRSCSRPITRTTGSSAAASYSGYRRLRCRQAWRELFGAGQRGRPREAMRDLIGRYRRNRSAGFEDPVIGCVFMLRDTAFFRAGEPPPTPEDRPERGAGQGLRAGGPSGCGYVAEPVARLLGAAPTRHDRGELSIFARARSTRGQPRLSPRNGSASRRFEAVVLRAYAALCGHRRPVLPALQAAHIRPRRRADGRPPHGQRPAAPGRRPHHVRPRLPRRPPRATEALLVSPSLRDSSATARSSTPGPEPIALPDRGPTTQRRVPRVAPGRGVPTLMRWAPTPGYGSASRR